MKRWAFMDIVSYYARRVGQIQKYFYLSLKQTNMKKLVSMNYTPTEQLYYLLKLGFIALLALCQKCSTLTTKNYLFSEKVLSE